MADEGGMASVAPLDLDARVERAAAQLEEIARQLERVREDDHERQGELSRLRDAVLTIEGRTQRHEAGQDTIAELRQELTELGQKFEQEAALRRDLAAALERSFERDRETQRTLASQVQAGSLRLAEVEQRTSGHEAERRALKEGVSEELRRGSGLEERVDALELRAGAERDALHALAQQVAGMSSALPGVVTAFDELDHRTRETQLDQRRAGDAISALQSERAREAELLELIEQQRATRQRLEERMVAAEEGLEAARALLAEASEQRAMLRQQVAGAEQRLLTLRETVEAHRVAILEHLRLLLHVQEETGRRGVEEAERRNRLARDLLVRFTERSGEVAREQPL